MPQTVVFADLLRDYLSGKIEKYQKDLLYEMVCTGNYDQIISEVFNESGNGLFFLPTEALTITAQEKLFQVILQKAKQAGSFHRHKDPHLTLRWWVLCLVVSATLAFIYMVIKFMFILKPSM